MGISIVQILIIGQFIDKIDLKWIQWISNHTKKKTDLFCVIMLSDQS